MSNPQLPRGRTIVAKTCTDCGELKMRSDYYGKKSTGDRICKACHKAKSQRRHVAKGKTPRLYRSGMILVAKTCARCRELKMAAAFPVVSNGRPGSYCKACKLEAETYNPESRGRIAREARARYQAETMGNASRAGQQWTGPEMEIAARADLTARQAALMLGRSYAAVCLMRQALRHDPKIILAAGLPLDQP